MTSSIDIRPYQAGDEKHILGLRKAVFGNIDPIRLREAAWRWQFGENPAGRACIFLAWHQGRCVGQYAAMPVRMRVLGMPETWAFSCDTMVHPRFQRKGLFAHLARKTYQALETEREVTRVWGFPNPQSMPGFVKKLGWRPLGATLAGLAPARAGRSVRHWVQNKKHLEMPLPGGLAVQRVREFGPWANQLWDKHLPLSGIAQERDAAYLNWRYLAMRDFFYRAYLVRNAKGPAAWFVVRTQKVFGLPVLAVMDLFPAWDMPPKALAALTGFVRSMAGAMGCPSAAAMLAPAGRLPGFYPVPQAISPKPLILAGRMGPNREPGLFRRSNWMLSFGDTDVV